MDDVKNQTILLSIIGIATLLVAIVGASFAWFSISLTGNEDAKDVIVTTASLGSVTFNDGSAIDASDILPGTKKTKTFTIAQTDPSATETIKYNIKLNINSNTITPNAMGQFVHSITGSGNTNGGTLVSLTETEVPETSIIIGSGELDGYEIHSYEYSIGLNNLNVDQSAASGKLFSGYITVELAESNKYQAE